jgi:hypothetical protein
MTRKLLPAELARFSLVACCYAVILHGLEGCRGYTVDTVDYGSPQRGAAIVIGDPQVYSRASLINDRRRETDYLQQLLANSAVDSSGKSVVNFSPQIIRDLKTVQVLSANLGLNVGKAITDSSTAPNLTNEIETTQLKAQLAVLQKQVEGIQNATAPSVTIPAPDLTSADSQAAAKSSNVLMPDVSTLQAAIKNIQTQLSSLTSVSGPSAPKNDYAGLTDPRNDFTDRQAYRRDIRAALSEAQLDDVHDIGGNALYRLQFQATVLPLSDTSKQWGAAMMSIEPPSLNVNGVSSAYYQWLGYISSQLSTPVQGKDDSQATIPNRVHSFDLDRYLGEVGRPYYFNVIDLFTSIASPDQFFCLDHRTAEASQLVSMSKSQDATPTKEKSLLAQYEYRGTYAVPPALIGSDDCNSYPASNVNYKMGKSLAAEVAKSVIGWIRQYTPQHSTLGLEGYYIAGKRGLTNKGTTTGNLDPLDYIPPEFCIAIIDSRDADVCNHLANASDAYRFRVAGGRLEEPSGVGNQGPDSDYAVRSYSVLPTELAQRLGVTTEASQSIQTALSIGAQVSAVANASLGAGYLSQSDVRAQALAREPLVVGFAGSEPGVIAKTGGRGYFGWLFGPEYVVKDSRTLALQQGVHSYGVNADVSFPGWWGYVDLNISTAWISNWQSTDTLPTSLTNDHSVIHKRVSLPVTDSTYESLTSFIAAKPFGPQNSHIFISYVSPTLISACSSNVTFQIGGTNIWRADNIYLGGVKAKTINVLPDMNGIAAEFDMNAVFGALANTDETVQSVELMVSAEQGSAAPFHIWVVGKRQTSNGATTCQSPILLADNLETVAPTIISYTPTEICTDATGVPLVVQGINLPDFAVLSGPLQLAGKWQGDPFRRAAYLALRKGMKLTVGTVPVALGADYGSLGVSFAVKDCPAEAKNATQTDTTSKKGGASPAKPALQTAAVQLAKNQKIVVKTSVPPSFAAITMAVRPQTKANNLQWTLSTSTVVVAGTPGTVTGTFDLSNLNAAVGAKLDVQVTIQGNPNLEPSSASADKELTVAAATATPPLAAATAKPLTKKKPASSTN